MGKNKRDHIHKLHVQMRDLPADRHYLSALATPLAEVEYKKLSFS